MEFLSWLFYVTLHSTVIWDSFVSYIWMVFLRLHVWFISNKLGNDSLWFLNTSQRDVKAFMFLLLLTISLTKAEITKEIPRCDIYSPMWKSIRVPAWENVKKNLTEIFSTVYGPSLSQQFSHQSLSSFWHHLFLCSGLLVHTLTKFYVPFPFSDSSNSASRILGMNTVKIW